MSFTIDEVKLEAEGLIDEEIEEEDAVAWANACIDAMKGKAWRELLYYFNAIKNKWYDLPSNFVRTISLVTSLGLPTGLTVTPTGTPGTTTWGYAITAINAVGETIACTEVLAATGNAVLSSSNYNALAWTAVTGATSYGVYRKTAGGTPATTGLIALPTTNSYNDQGAAISGGILNTPYEDTSISCSDYSGYSIRNRRIKFNDTDKYVLTYTAYPTKVSTLKGATGTPDLPDMFKYPMTKYLASRYRSKDDSSDPDAQKWMAEFTSDLNDILAELEQDNDVFQTEVNW